MPNRNDIRGDTRAPQSYEDFLVSRYGKTPFGEPMLRLVLAQNRMMQAGGEFWDWKEGSSLTDKGGINYPRLMKLAESGISRAEFAEALAEEKSKKPERRKTEIRWIPKYTGEEGWVLELWHPASKYGSRDEWYRAEQDGVPICGPYPEKGDYEAITYPPTPHLPSFDEMQNAVRYYYAQFDQRPMDPSIMLQLRLAEVAEAEEKFKREQADWIDQKVKEINQMLTSSSLEASRWRNETAAKLGIKEHIGILQPDAWESSSKLVQ